MVWETIKTKGEIVAQVLEEETSWCYRVICGDKILDMDNKYATRGDAKSDALAYMEGLE